MNKKTNKAISLLFIAVIMTSFTGCLNLFSGSSSPTKVSTGENERNDHQGVFKTTDGGMTWEHKIKTTVVEETDGDSEGSSEEESPKTEETILDKRKISSMKMDPQNNQVLYLGTVGDGLYKSEDGADLWSKIDDENKLLDDLSTVFSIAIEKENSNIIYVATLNRNRGELLRSEDGGKTWVSSYISAELGKPINYVQIDANHSNIIYIGTEQGGLIKSDNRGNTWYTLEWFPAGVKDFVVDFQNNDGIIVRVSNNVYKTIDGGENWEELKRTMYSSLNLRIDFTRVSSMTIDSWNPLVVYMTYKNLILVTRDGGYIWEKMNTITPALTALGTAPQVKQIGMMDSIIYYGAGNALYKSHDKGVSWSSYDIPIKGDVRYTVNDHSNSDIIYLGAFYDLPPKK